MLKRHTIFSQAEQIPPFLCRIIARRKHGWEPMSVRDIAAASGLTKTRVAIIAKRKTWAGIAIDHVERFSRACGVDLLHPAVHKHWLRQSNLRHIMRAQKRQKAGFLELLKG